LGYPEADIHRYVHAANGNCLPRQGDANLFRHLEGIVDAAVMRSGLISAFIDSSSRKRVSRRKVCPSRLSEKEPLSC